MKYLKVNGNDTYVEYNEIEKTSRVVVKSKLEKQISEAQNRLKAIPESIDDKELLAWARINHPRMMDYSIEKANLEKIIADNTAILEELK